MYSLFGSFYHSSLALKTHTTCVEDEEDQQCERALNGLIPINECKRSEKKGAGAGIRVLRR